ncbi:sensor histidine kinase [Clostridium cellulovorans]|uniref:histidine kinase n=1 Tax=Clostridium cellulovorans (strain ATCC 35296 / DSM 3052 / OCM 3 / 743B) TaxID=573061 RepID=D9SN71_CLOC7|nr:HAMP domain-containing sensor histidine kinase [Clostridium cellulovorans]ADL53863.1 histidine kinase [Clostridium cellulovorans 743B]
MLWVIFFLLTIISVLLTYIYRYKKDINKITEQITKTKGEYYNIRMMTLDKDIEELVLSINRLYEDNQKINCTIKHREEELRRSIENLSHDLRTPLTSIMGYLQLVKDENTSEDDCSRYMEIIERRTVALQELIISFYDLSRVESSEYNFELRSVNLSNMLYETIALFYEDFTKKNIEPEVIAEITTANVIADEKAVMRIFSNLINNVLKHGEKSVVITLKKEGTKIITEFKNYAPRLKEEQVKHIFDRFYTADSTRSDKNTGLGLSITKALVEQLGNKIKAELIDGMLIIKITWNGKENL